MSLGKPVLCCVPSALQMFPVCSLPGLRSLTFFPGSIGSFIYQWFNCSLQCQPDNLFLPTTVPCYTVIISWLYLLVVLYYMIDCSLTWLFWVIFVPWHAWMFPTVVGSNHDFSCHDCYLPWLFPAMIASCHDCSCNDCFLPRLFPPSLFILFYFIFYFWSCSFIVDWYGFLICSCNILNFYKFFFTARWKDKVLRLFTGWRRKFRYSIGTRSTLGFVT